MPAKKKDASTRRRRNKASTSATLTRPTLRSVEDLSDLTVAQLRAGLVEANQSRPADHQLPVRGTKSELVERLAAANSPVPLLPDHPPRYDSDGYEVRVLWHEQTYSWWNDVWTSPMADEWDHSDVHNVMVVALLYDDIWAASTPKERKDALSEYRLQRADLGLSPYSRRRLEWTIEVAGEAKSRGEQRRAGQPASAATGGSKKKPAVDPRAILSAVE